MPRLVFSYADAKTNPLTPKWKLGSAKEWIHPINWIGGPRSFGSFHRVELDELIRRDSSLPEIPEDIRDLIVQFKALELFAVGLTKLHLRRQDVKKVFRDSNEFVWDGLRTHELGQGNAALMLGAILVWGKQLHGHLKWQEKPYRGYGYALLDFPDQREYALLHTLYVAMWTLGDDDSRLALHDSAVSRNVEVLDDEATRIIPLGKGRLIPFTSPQTVWQDMKAAFRPRKPFLRSILARIIYELGASSYRGAMDLSRSIVDDEQRLINYIANDKRRNTMVRYDIERVYRSFARKGRGLSSVQIQKIRKRQKQLRKQEQDRRIGKRIDRTRIPGREVSLTDYYRNYGDFLRLNKVGKVKRTGPKNLNSNLDLAVPVINREYAYEAPRYHTQLKPKEIKLILNHMDLEIFGSLRFGATLRHKAKYSQPFHQHLLDGRGAFSVAYERIGGDDHHLRAVIYDVGELKKKNKKNAKTVYKWRHGKPSGGASHPIPKDLRKAMVRPGNQRNRVRQN